MLLNTIKFQGNFPFLDPIYLLWDRTLGTTTEKRKRN